MLKIAAIIFHIILTLFASTDSTAVHLQLCLAYYGDGKLTMMSIFSLINLAKHDRNSGMREN